MKQREKVRVSLTLDDDVVEKVGEIADAQRTNMSALINVTLAERFLDDKDCETRGRVHGGGR